MSAKFIPNIFSFMLSDKCIKNTDIIGTSDRFFMIKKSMASILSTKGVYDLLNFDGKRVSCSKFFDDWFLYAVPNDSDYTYSLLKLREQEYDADQGAPADGDMPGVTISFIEFNIKILLTCLDDPTDDNRQKLNFEINRVVAYKGQHHHKALKKYFINPTSQGAYLVANTYIKHIASYSCNGQIKVPEYYKKIVQQSILHRHSRKLTRLPRFIDTLNVAAKCVVCDNENIYIKNQDELSKYEANAILATHTGNTSLYSFAAEVEYHARYLTSWAKITIPFWNRSLYDSAIRADMTIGDSEFEGSAPFYNDHSKIVKRQHSLHCMLWF